MVYVTDPIGDLLTRMRNAQNAKHTHCKAPWSRMKQQLCELLKTEGWIADVAVEGDAPFQELNITFAEDKPSLELTRISKPGRRVYVGYQDLKPVLHGFGSAVLTTSQGVMTDTAARAQKLGGEVLCTIA